MRKNSGFSLIELMVVMIILGAVVAITIGLLITTSRNAANQSIQGHIEQQGHLFVDRCKLDLGYAQMGALAGPSVGGITAMGIVSNTSGTEIRFKHQISVDASTSANNPAYGYSTKLGTLLAADSAAEGRMAVIRFEAHTVLRESAAAPSTTITQPAAGWGGTWVAPPSPLAVEIVDWDVNNDGDKTDRFLMGKVIKYVSDNAGVRFSKEELSDYVILRYDSATAIYATPTGATNADRMFSYLPDSANIANLATNAKQVKVNVMLGRMDERRQKFLSTTCSEQVYLRNKQ